MSRSTKDVKTKPIKETKKKEGKTTKPTKETKKKEGKDKTACIQAMIKKLSKSVPKSSNEKEFNKFLIYIEKRAATFDPESSTYVDYAQKEIERNKPVQRFAIKTLL